MASHDFRRVDVSALRWMPAARKSIPLHSAVTVQTPPSPCTVTTFPGRHALQLRLGGHAAHPQFLDFLGSLEDHARAAACPPPGLRLAPCVARDGMWPTLKMSAFEGAAFFDRDGAPHADPEAMRGCECLCQVVGAWVGDGAWGLRWKVLEVKECDAPAPPMMFC
jgi:hypothetical protein